MSRRNPSSQLLWRPLARLVCQNGTSMQFHIQFFQFLSIGGKDGKAMESMFRFFTHQGQLSLCGIEPRQCFKQAVQPQLGWGSHKFDVASLHWGAQHERKKHQKTMSRYDLTAYWMIWFDATELKPLLSAKQKDSHVDDWSILWRSVTSAGLTFWTWSFWMETTATRLWQTISRSGHAEIARTAFCSCLIQLSTTFQQFFLLFSEVFWQNLTFLPMSWGLVAEAPQWRRFSRSWFRSELSWCGPGVVRRFQYQATLRPYL